jgi:uncharacterized protein (TIGR02391 family)
VNPLPPLKTDRKAAVAALRKILDAGNTIIEGDPLKGRRASAGTEEIREAARKMRQRSARWSSEASTEVNKLFSASILARWDLAGDLYPRLNKLEQILYAVEHPDDKSGQRQLKRKLATRGANELHPKIAERSLPAYRTAQYDDAVFGALKAIEHEIRLRIAGDPDDVGVQLVSRAMNPKAPILVFSGVPAEQEAAHSLFRGAIGMFKNPLSHRFLDISDPTRAWEILTFASLLMKLLDEAKSQAAAAQG